ncbi:hypothetical protein SBRCBS47491_002667 [Sporothrix bragantina]|uniref:Uncharacterized protein n=1 Tax=Sporothrix bragantina TaxID=671064 RepID=A0ABP0B8V8_9PEZI
MADFSAKYVATNNRKGAPEYDKVFIDSLREQLLKDAPELISISDAILAAIAIGAHRADVATRLFEQAIVPVVDDKVAVLKTLNLSRAVLMIVWPFVGIPWCVPAALGIVDVLRRHNVEDVVLGDGGGNIKTPQINDSTKDAGQQLLGRTYQNVNNGEVQEMLRTFFPDFAHLTWTVVFGCALAGTTATGILEEKQTQLVLATATVASGALRQARSHLKAAVGLGISASAAAAVSRAAVSFSTWNGVEITGVSEDDLY